MNIVNMGCGEVGNALKEICEEKKHTVFTIEKDSEDVREGEIDVMFVNIPYNADFVSLVLNKIDEVSPKFVIINSTVDVGITRTIQKDTDVPVVHSPVRGIHPYLKEGIKTFVKYIGATDPDKAEKGIEILEALGLKTRAFNSPETTEFAKLMSTTTYGLYIEWATEFNKMCKKLNIDFDEAYVDWTLTYNTGYMELGMPNVVRPILKPNKGGLLGHCIIENCGILYQKSKAFFDGIGKVVLSAGRGTENISNPYYKNYGWLLCEYIGKDKNAMQIAKEQGVSGTIISYFLKKFKIERKINLSWTNEEDEMLEELSKEMSFKKISEKYYLKRTHNSIRIRAIALGIKSIYEPGEETKKIDIKKKISCTLQKIKIGDFNGFKTPEHEAVRHSVEYQKWRYDVFKRDKYTCQDCKKIGHILHAHHIKEFAKFKEEQLNVDNGITLCKECHGKRHSKRV